MQLKLIFTFFITIISIQFNFALENKFTPTLFQIDSILKSNSDLMHQINVNDVDMLMLNDCRLNEVEAALEFLRFENIASQINFKKNEEIAIYEYFAETITQSNQLRVIINQYISNIDFWYYKKGMDFLAKTDTINAMDKLDKALLANPFYIPALYQKAMLYLFNSQTNKASGIAIKVALNLYPTGNDWMLIRAMNEQINKQFKTRGEKMLAVDYCNESLEIFMQADTFCTYFTSIDCEYVKKGISDSKYGLYRSYLRVADQAMEAHKYAMAETFVMKAKEYASANRSTIINDETADKFLKRIFNKYMDLALTYKRSADSRSSIYIEKANTLCSIIKDSECEAAFLLKKQEIEATTAVLADHSTDITPEPAVTTFKNKYTHKRIRNQHKRNNKYNTTNTKKKTSVLASRSKKILKSKKNNAYSSLIELGNQLSLETKYDEAIVKYQTAKAMKEKSNPKQYVLLDSIISATAINIIHSQLQKADFSIWANELNKADSVYHFCVSIQQKYQLENNVSLNASLNQFKIKMAAKSCQNIQEQLDLLNNKITNYILLKEFTKAQLSLNEAHNTISNNIQCTLQIAKTDQLSKQLQPITEYYRLKETGRTAYEKGDYKLFTESYDKSDQLYLQSKLDTIGIPDNNIIAYLNYQSNEASIVYAANYFIEFYHFDNCLALLKLLKNKGINAPKVKDIQLKLALKQAKIDKAQLLFDAKTNILKYTGNDKWFSVFNAEYKKK